MTRLRGPGRQLPAAAPGTKAACSSRPAASCASTGPRCRG